MSKPLRLVLMSVTLGLSSCGDQEQPPSILLVTFDSLRADAVFPEGRQPPTHLGALALEAVAFPNAIATAPWTLPSLASILTGLSPFAHTVKTHKLALPANAPVLAARLKERGYATAVIGSNPFLEPRFGLTRGFDEIAVGWKTGRPVQATPEPGAELPTQEITARALAWIDLNHDRPFFMWVHYYDPHLPYAPPSQWTPAGSEEFMAFHQPEDPWFVAVEPQQARRRARALYDAEVAFVDAEFGRLLARLQELGIYHQTGIVATSDHGEEFWEHNDWGHGRSLYDETIRVPLIVKAPGRQAGRQIQEQVSLERIAATIAAWSGIGDGSAASLLGQPFVQNEDVIVATCVARGEDQAAVIFGRYKYVLGLSSGDERLYDRESDPSESDNIAARAPETRRSGAQLLEEARRSANQKRMELRLQASAAAQDLEHLEHLRGLGYVQR